MVIAAFVVCFLWKDLLVQDSSDSSLIDDDGAGLIFFRLIIQSRVTISRVQLQLQSNKPKLIVGWEV